MNWAAAYLASRTELSHYYFNLDTSQYSFFTEGWEQKTSPGSPYISGTIIFLLLLFFNVINNVKITKYANDEKFCMYKLSKPEFLPKFTDYLNFLVHILD